MIPAELPTRTIEPGTPIVKVIPPRLVEPYLAGQRSVIAGYVYRAQDCSCRTPADFYQALALGYEGSEFAPDMPELFVMRWIALDMSASLVGSESRPPSHRRAERGGTERAAEGILAIPRREGR